jgi:hypothetical protein
LAVQSVDPEPITTFCAGDDALAAIVARGLRRSPDERWQSAGELADELCHWLLARGVETDICDHSLRARLLERSGAESGHEATYAHVVPGSVRRAIPAWKRLSIGAAAGAALLALASTFQALRADDHSRARADPKATVAATRPPSAAPAAARTNEAAEAPRTPSPASQVLATIPAAEPVPASAPVPPPAVRAWGALSATPIPSMEPPAAPVVPAAQQPPVRRRSRNALNYDFGL